MNRYFSKIKWQGTILVISVILLFLTIPCFEYIEILKGIFIGIIAATILLILIECRELKRDKAMYGKMEGTYERIDIFNVNHKATENSKYESLVERYKNIYSRIELKYLGERQYRFEAEYEEGRKRAVVYIDQTNTEQGSGHYQYISKKKPEGILPDIGYFRIQVDTLDPNKLYVFHKNIIPSGLAEGYETWKRH